MIHFERLKPQLTNFGPSVNIDGFLSYSECDKVVALMQQQKLTQALISEVGVKNTSIRSTELCALEHTQENLWIFAKLEDAITQVNADVYGYELAGFSEAIQLMQYQEGGHYDWHADSGNLQFSRRKLSFSVQLSNPADYEGGELEFFRNGVAPKDKGTLIIFPPYFYHRVTEVTEGIRRAIVGWVDGDPFR